MAGEFGDKLKERLRLLVTYDAGDLEVPGTFPYQTTNGEFPFKVETNEYCIYCMLCADVCPVKAISESNPKEIDSSICLRCGSCLRICPTQAKYFTEEPFKVLQEKLSLHCATGQKEIGIQSLASDLLSWQSRRTSENKTYLRL